MRLPPSSSSDASSGDDDDKPLVVNVRSARGAPSLSNGKGKRRHESDSGDDAPLVKRVKNGSPSRSHPPPRPKRKQPVEPSSDSESDVPLSSPAKPAPAASSRLNGAHHANGKANGAVKMEVDSDDAPLTSKKAKAKPKPAKKKVKQEGPASDGDVEQSDYDDDDDKPIKKKAKPKPKPKAPAKKKVKDEDEDDDDKPLVQKAAPKKPAAKKPAENAGEGSPKKKKKKGNEEDDEEEVFRWWDADQPNGDGSQKWQTLNHNGVLFPPPYEPLPEHVKMLYDGKPVELPYESEEVAWFYGQMLETDHAQDPVFQKNFFGDWQKVLRVCPPINNIQIKEFAKCDFRPMFEHFEAERARKKAIPAAEKKELKKERDAFEAPFKTCTLDGRKEKVGNFRIEPPGLFRGRGEHPKKGSLKFRLRPEDITINISEGVPVPTPGMPGKWANVVHDQTVSWLATWKENVNGQPKYVFLAAGSSLKGQSDMQKFEKARELKKYVDAIRRDYQVDLKSKIMADRQRATAMYFIDFLALRAGNEKGEEEADTVGCCSLRCEHVTLEPPNFVVFDFLGKDSIRYYNRVGVEQQVFKNIRIFKGDQKNDDDALFDRVTTASLNKHLASYMKGLTAKVFRTYNASITFQKQLDAQDLKSATVAEKIAAYNQANRKVAELCNHQRSVPKTHGAAMEKLTEKLRALKYNRMKLRHALFTVDPKMKKKRADLDEMESDIDDDWVANHEDGLRKSTIEKAEKKFAKENEKLEAEGESAQKESALKQRIDAIEEEYDRLKAEQGTGRAELKSARSAENIVTMIEKLEEKIKTFKVQMADRDGSKEVSLGTSKINYLDPRITAAWCKIHDVPIEKIFNRSLLVKFPWAMGADKDWKF